MNRRAAIATIFFALASVVSTIHAAIFVVPPDAEMVQKSMAVVDGTVVEVYYRYSPEGNVQTVNRVAILDVMKGPIRQFNVIDVVQLGGVMGDFHFVNDAAPLFSTGDEVILFLEKDKYGDWTSWQNALGSFRQEYDRMGRRVVTRTAGDVSGWDEQGNQHVEMVRQFDGFEEFIRGVARGENPVEGYLLPFTAAPSLHAESTGVPHVEFTGYDYTAFSNTSQHLRRTNVTRAWHVCTAAGAGGGSGGCGGGSEGGFDIGSFVADGTAAWSNEPSSTVNYSRGSDTSSTAWQCGGHNNGGDFSESNLVLPNDPLGDIPGSFTGSGEVAQAEFGFNGSTNTNPADGQTYETIICGDILYQDGLTSSFGSQAMDTATTHELGHTLGFRHSNKGPDNGACPGTSDCQTHAIMNSCIGNAAGCVSGIGATLQAWDISAVQNTYGSGAVCTPPNITTQPMSKQISVGASTTLTVAASGTPTLSFQWFKGSMGDTSTPVGTNSSTLNTGVLNSTTNFWVRVTGSCAPVADSNTATVTVCNGPVINSQSMSQTVNMGDTPTLTVTATGATSFQWFNGSAPSTASPIGGATMSSFTTPPINATTSFWVQVTNSCGTANSTTITLSLCVPPSVSTQPANKQISTGDSTSLSVVAAGSGPFTYQWFTGPSGDTASPISPGGTGTTVTVSPTMTTSYWVQVTGQCGSPANSNTATVTICNRPTITSHSPNQTVNPGDTAMLSVTATNATGFQWFQGSSGNTSNPIFGATSSTFTTGPINATSSFWVQVSNSCGSTNSATIVISLCALPNFTHQPQDQTILAGTSTSITFSANGTQPISVIWFRGMSGDTSNPTGSTSNPLMTGLLNSTTQFWARISNSCGTTDSRTVTITVTTNCVAPAITSQPAGSSVNSGSTATLTVTATGTSLTYQWFKGSVGDTSTPVGTNSSMFTTDPLSATISFWVRVSNGCGTVNSAGATVTVTTSCVAVSITTEPAAQSIAPGSSAMLSVTAAGTETIHYQWYQGDPGDKSIPVGSDSATISVGPLTATTTFWVEVTNDCGVADSSAAIVTVSGCHPPTITTQPKSTAVETGLHATLTVVATGDALLNYQWFQGSTGDTSNPVGPNSASFVAPVSSTAKSYWVRVTNGCGHADSDTAVVSIARRHAIRRHR